MSFASDPLPGRVNSNAEGIDSGEIEEYQERRELLHEVTQDTRFNLIQTILMHPKQLPSMEEFAYMHPDRNRATLREHLETLIELGIVRKVELSKEEITRDNPRVFYGLSEIGEEILDEFGLLDIVDTLQYLYQNMEKPEQILQAEKAPRPE